MRRVLAGLLIAVIVALVTVSCGGSDSPSSPTPTPTPTPTPNPSTATITITSAGVSPRSVTIAVGGRVTFVNNDTRQHDMSSNPHPEHTDCPAMRDVGFLVPMQSKTSGNFTTARTCGFHDHGEPSTVSLQGTIVIQ